MATTKRVPLDTNGNDIPAPDMTTDVGQLIYLLEYGRLAGFRIGPTVQLGQLTLQVRDLRQREDAEESQGGEQSIWKEHGYDGE